MSKNVIRIWLDEFLRRNLNFGSSAEPDWRIRGYQRVQDKPGYFYTRWFEVELLQGPRRGNEKLRFKTDCSRTELK